MTLNGAIMQLVEMRENSMMPDLFKPYFDKVIETISECVEPSEIPHWISCNEKLPEKEGFYSVTLYHEGVDSYYCSSALFLFKSCNYPGMRNFWVPHDDEVDVVVVAWQPLPEPYKERREE